jgi:hypothetical protein
LMEGRPLGKVITVACQGWFANSMPSPLNH